MNRTATLMIALAAGLALAAPAARADHRYFLQSYPSLASPKGETEVSLWSRALLDQGSGSNTAWENRAEFEYAVTGRLGGSLFLNWSQAAGDSSAQRFDGPSVALVYSFADEGKIALNPALYFEVEEDGNAITLYPSLLLEQKAGRWMAGGNVAGEIETLHHPAAGQNRSESMLSLTGGLSRDLGKQFALGVEGRYSQVYPGGSEHPSAFFAGPTLDLDADKVQLVLGWYPQLSGSPETRKGLNLSEFSRSEFRMILSIEL